MNERGVALLIGMVVVLSATTLAGAASTGDDWPDEQSNARTVEVPGDEVRTVDGVLAPGSETDWLRVPVDRGDVLSVDLEKDALDDVRLQLRFWNNYHGERPAWRKRDVADRGAETLNASVASAASGNVTIQVYSETSREKDWRLQLDREPGGDAYPVPVTVEPGTYSGSIDGWRDRDELRIRAGDGDVVRMTLEKPRGSPVRLEGPRSCCGGSIDRETTRIVRRYLVEGRPTPRNVSAIVTGDPGPASQWTLILERFEDADRWPSEPREVYPGTTHRGAIDTSEDRDALEVPMLAGDTVTVSLQKTAGEYVQMHVRGPEGRLALDYNNKSGSHATVTFNATEAGFATVDLWGHLEGAEANGWEVTLSGNRSTEFWIERRGPSHAPTATPTSEPPPPTAATTGPVTTSAATNTDGPATSTTLEPTTSASDSARPGGPEIDGVGALALLAITATTVAGAAIWIRRR